MAATATSATTMMYSVIPWPACFLCLHPMSIPPVGASLPAAPACANSRMPRRIKTSSRGHILRAKLLVFAGRAKMVCPCSPPTKEVELVLHSAVVDCSGCFHSCHLEPPCQTRSPRRAGLRLLLQRDRQSGLSAMGSVAGAGWRPHSEPSRTAVCRRQRRPSPGLQPFSTAWIPSGGSFGGLPDRPRDRPHAVDHWRLSAAG